MKNINISKQSIMRINIFLAVFLGILSLQVFAQNDLIPADNNDLQQIIDKVKEIKNITRRCADGDCPPIDCETARKINEEVLEAQYYAKYNYFWMRLATQKHKDQWQLHVNNSIRDGERLAKVQTILAWQEYVVNVSNLLLDVSSAASNLDSLLKNPQKMRELSASELLNEIDTVYEFLKSYSNAVKTLDKDALVRLPDTPDIVFSGEEIDRYKSDFSDIKTVLSEAAKNGSDWKKTLGTEKVRVAAGQILGRVVLHAARQNIEERKRFAASLAREISATDRVLADRHKEYVRYMNRRNLAENAYLAIENLFRPSEGGSWGKCLGKLTPKCLSFRTTANGLMPDYAEVIFYRDNFDLAQARRPENWGRALRHLKPVVQNLSKDLNEVEIPDSTVIEPSLKLAKTEFEPDETIKVEFTAPSCYPMTAWIGIVPGDVEHGDAGTNVDKAITYQQLRDETSGEKSFKAPDEGGSYDIRMNNPETGKEVFSVTFNVTARTVDSQPKNNDPTMPTSTGKLPISVPLPEGNWFVEWQNAPVETEQRARVVITNGVEYKCLALKSGGCWHGFRRQPGADWFMNGLAYYSSGEHSQIYNNRLTVESSGINMDYYKQRLQINGENNLHGTWTGYHNGEDISGQANWRRALPKINRAVFRFNANKRGEPERFIESQMSLGGQPTEVKMWYDGNWWGQGNNMRGNRPRFRVDIYGENLWGLHYQWIDRKTGLELAYPIFICGDGTRTKAWKYCTNGLDVVGISYEVIIWHWVKPGMKTIYLDGTPITFDMKIIGLLDKVTIKLSCANSESIGKLIGTVLRNDEPFSKAMVNLRVRYSDGEENTRKVIADINGRFLSDFPFIPGKRGKVEASVIHNGDRIISKPCEL